MTPGRDDVTVVVPVRDDVRGVDRLLARLAPDLRCIVVDDASAAALELAAVVERHGAQLVRLDRNVGPAAARDVGLGMVTTSCVAFVDADVEATTEVLEALLPHFADPALAAVAPRIVSRPGRSWIARYERAGGSLDLGARPATVRRWSRAAYLPSACLVARVATLGEGFDPRLRSGEDVDLVWRLQDDGYRVRHAAEVEVVHDARPTITGWLGRKAFYGTSAAPLAARHGNRVAPAVLTPAVAGAALGLLLPGRWSTLLAGACTTRAVAATVAPVPDLPARGRAGVVRAAAASHGRQLSSLALRHWWPLALAAALVSRRARRVLALTAVADGVLAHRASGAELDVVRFTLARRADDVAYGAGVWWGAARAGSVRCLLPHWIVGQGRRGRS